MFINISEILNNARSHLVEVRTGSEKLLEKMACEDFYQFLMHLAKELSSESSSTKMTSNNDLGYFRLAIEFNSFGKWSASFLNGITTENFCFGATSSNL